MLAKRKEIDDRTLKLIVGLIALTLGSVTGLLTHSTNTSISESYYLDQWARNILVGSLFAIAAFLIAYNGESWYEMLMSKLAAGAAIGVAMLPCGCGGRPEIIVHAHYIAAGIMFAVLAGFCVIFYRRAVGKGHKEAIRRSRIYLFCCVLMIFSIGVLLLNVAMHEALLDSIPRLVFWGETGALVAFAGAWLTASKVVPGIAADHERLFASNAA